MQEKLIGSNKLMTAAKMVELFTHTWSEDEIVGLNLPFYREKMLNKVSKVKGLQQ